MIIPVVINLTRPLRAQLARALLLTGLACALPACVIAPSTKPPASAASEALKQQHLQSLAAIQQFSLQGRIGIQTYGKGFSGSMHWQHDSTGDDIALYSPLGGQVAGIKNDAEQITLEDNNGKIYTAADAETLTQTVLGWQLPLKGLVDWSLGRPASSAIQGSTWNEQGLLTTLDQDGWKIEYDNYAEQDGYTLPGKIFLKSEKLNLKLLVEKWNNVRR